MPIHTQPYATEAVLNKVFPQGTSSWAPWSVKDTRVAFEAILLAQNAQGCGSILTQLLYMPELKDLLTCPIWHSLTTTDPR